MAIEIQDIRAFVSAHEPFENLPEDVIDELCSVVEISYFRAQSQILHLGDAIDALHLIRSGAVEVSRRTGELFNRLEPGQVFGQLGILMNGQVRYPARALEDTLIYLIPADVFMHLCQQHAEFGDFFEVNEHSTLKQGVLNLADDYELTSVRVCDIIRRKPVVLSADCSIQECAKRMTEQRISSVIVVDNNAQTSSKSTSEGADSDSEKNRDIASIPAGIVTDRDLRKRVLTNALSLDTPVRDIMTAELVTLRYDAYLYEAMLVMMRQNVHHLPLLQRGQLKGVVALSDIVRHESQNSLLLVRGIFAQTGIEGLRELSRQVGQVMVRMQKQGATSHMIGTALSVIGRSFKQRLLQLAEEQFGTPPVPYCFLALGSMAREEQLLVTDQDNAIILAPDYDEALHGGYFKRFADFVCDGLACCGYSYCDGGIMASNSQWRLTLQDWKKQFSQWIDRPDPQALLYASIFFDLTGVAGKTVWAEQLTRFIANKAKDNRAFLASLARNALNRTPPLGFFKDFVLEKDGKQRYSINLKRRGSAPMVDVIRVHALAQGSLAQNSFDRLQDIAESTLLPGGKADELHDALEYISIVRIRQQALAFENHEEAGNSIEPETLSSKERRALKEAFQVLNNAQKFLRYRYTAQK